MSQAVTEDIVVEIATEEEARQGGSAWLEEAQADAKTGKPLGDWL